MPRTQPAFAIVASPTYPARFHLVTATGAAASYPVDWHTADALLRALSRAAEECPTTLRLPVPARSPKERVGR